MKKRDVVVGKRYTAKVSGKSCMVRILRESQYGGWDAVNESTGREIRIKSAQRLRPTLRDVLDEQHKARTAALEAAPLTAFERWMVQSNLKDIQAGVENISDRATRLRANGYPKIATAVELEAAKLTATTATN